jgi:hypothetical protein
MVLPFWGEEVVNDCTVKACAKMLNCAAPESPIDYQLQNPVKKAHHCPLLFFVPLKFYLS